jgi:CheY-like chemotaxis protein
MTAPRNDPLDAEGIAEHHPLRVLVADDNSVVRAALLSLLRLCGCDADEASDGRRALELASRRRYDVLLIDVQMPEMDGPALSRALGATLPPDQRPHVVAMSADGAPEDHLWYRESGMIGFLSKPVRLDDLMRLLGSRAFAGTPTPAPQVELTVAAS